MTGLFLGIYMDIFMDAPDIKISQTNLRLISEIDEFKGKWQALSNLAPDQLDALKKVATIASVGSSTRIEGAKLSDQEVGELLSDLKISTFHSRDEEEVAGYAECMETVFESYDQIPVDENHIKQLHQIVLRYSSKDLRHRGDYKTHSNQVEDAFDQDGKRVGVVVQTASPFDTPRLMAELTEWLRTESRQRQTHPLLVIAVFIVHFLAIHPFQDGNGRLCGIIRCNGRNTTGHVGRSHVISTFPHSPTLPFPILSPPLPAPEPDRVTRQFGGGLQIQLFLDPASMRMDRAERQIEVQRDQLRSMAPTDFIQHFQLPVAEQVEAVSFLRPFFMNRLSLICACNASLK